MKNLFLISLLSLAACAQQETGRSVPTADLTPPSQSPRCESWSILGAWKTGGGQPAVTVNSDCTFRINACGTTYEVTNDVADSTFASPGQSVTVREVSHSFIQDGCLRPGVGDFTCTLKTYHDSGLNKDVLSLYCADDNFYHTPYSNSSYR